MTAVEAYPLAWPTGWDRTAAHKRQRARFSTSLKDARDGLLEEIRLTGGTQPVISTNIPTRRDGLPYASSKNPSDPGVAVYFALRREPQVLCCDRWETVADNLQALRLTLAALRGLERWGSSEMMSRVFQGFAALPVAETATPERWWVVLGIERHLPLYYVEATYKTLAKLHHPDRGGDPEMMLRLNRAIAEARAEKERK